MVYGSRFKTLAYTIKWDDAAFVSKFYEKLNNGQTGIVKKMMNIAVKIDDRQHDMFVDKKI